MSAEDWLDDIAQYLEDEGVGVYSPGTGEECNIFIHKMLDTPVPCICLYRYQGRESTRTHDDQVTRRPNLQVKARAKTEGEALALLEAVFSAINNKTNVAIGSHFYVEIKDIGDIMPLGWENGTIKLTQNYKTEWRI